MQMHPITSTNVSAVGYDPSSRRMRVQFSSGGIYEYSDVDESLYEAMLQPFPWRRVGRVVRAHANRRIG
ncbi:KTSC domain-containing protein [Curtobacterium sp. 9128]|uniref:KTSC domain-containing protein n=1 Tax=Curtobacterium sp. 9128 TaxID=1793722 RepID=UPI0007D731B5|nr:KTSC domain-containing protein [Curtobacterium sp. 9128]SBN61641.1 KTSC domain-containing protein [Curtobacterium sp. 9128]